MGHPEEVGMVALFVISIGLGRSIVCIINRMDSGEADKMICVKFCRGSESD